MSLVYFKLEMVVCATDDDTDPACLWPGNSQAFHNMQWFMSTLYPHFVPRARATGVIPSVYFLAGGTEPNYLDPAWRDPYYPELDGHASMSWVYRGLRFMQEQGLPIPDRIDFTTTANPPPAYTTVATVIARIYDDLQAILPAFQSPPYRYAAAETFYFADDSVRVAGSKPFASERMLGRGLAGVMAWPEIRPGTPTYDFRPFETAGTMVPFAGLESGIRDGGARRPARRLERRPPGTHGGASRPGPRRARGLGGVAPRRWGVSRMRGRDLGPGSGDARAGGAGPVLGPQQRPAGRRPPAVARLRRRGRPGAREPGRRRHGVPARLRDGEHARCVAALRGRGRCPAGSGRPPTPVRPAECRRRRRGRGRHPLTCHPGTIAR